MKKFLAISLSVVAVFFAFNLYSQSFVRIDDASRTVVAPSIVTVTTDAQYVFTANTTYLNFGRVLKRAIQNTGTNAVLYAIGSVASTSNYHGILAGGTAVRDGLGSVVDLSSYPGQVSIVTESGSSTVALVELQQ